MNISLPESKKMFTSERLANLSLICIEFKFLPSAASRLSNGIVYPFGFYKIVLKINIQKKKQHPTFQFEIEAGITHSSGPLFFSRSGLCCTVSGTVVLELLGTCKNVVRNRI